MSKTGKFIKIKTAVFIGGLCCTMPITQANASTTLACADCYRCTLGTEDACRGTCVYDADYCIGIGQECEDGYYWSDKAGECVPDLIAIDCADDEYYDGTSCVMCPISIAGGCTFKASAIGGGHTAQSCYAVANSCTFSDTTGTYTWNEDCYYQ